VRVIHKIAAVVIQDDKFLMVRKHGKDVWTSLGGKPEAGESEEQALLREIREEVGCGARVLRKLGDFEAKAVFDDALVRLSTYLVELEGEPLIQDPELEEFRFLSKDYREKGIKLPPSIEEQVIPYCIKEGLLAW
jgi:8-oxo-dGTP diphosphatase